MRLTEEWLFRCGFNYKSNNSYQLDSNLGFSIWGRIESGFYVYVDSNEIGEPIKYVHALQNLIYFLTSQELTIKDK